jgi:hypothetical protein
MGEQLRLPTELVGDMVCGCTGPPPRIQARAEIVRLQAAGYNATAIARSLNRRAVPTPSGRGRWWPETVKRHVNPEPWRRYIAQYRASHPRP